MPDEADPPVRDWQELPPVRFNNIGGWQFSSPREKKAVRNSPELEQLTREIRNNVYNNDTLRSVIASAGMATAMDYVRMANPRLMISTCHDCTQACFSVTLKTAYSGVRWICPSCVNAYVMCRQCDSLILCADTEVHFHGPELLRRRRENEVSAFDADVLATPGAEFRGARRPTLRSSRDIPSSPPDRFFGIELEMERKRDQVVPPDMILKAKALLKDAMVKHDGSLGAGNNGARGGNGFEVVTLPCTMDYHRNEAGWSGFFRVMSRWMQEKPVTTGLHVHVSTDSMTRATIGKIIKFINYSKNLEFLRMIADRDFIAPNPNGRVYANIYPDNVDKKVTELISRRTHTKGCRNSPIERIVRAYYLDGKTVKFDRNGHPIIQRVEGGTVRSIPCRCAPGKYDYAGHYAAFNIRTNRPTIEFRMFQGSTNEDHFWACLDFSDAIIRFCEATSFNDLTWQNFIDWFKTVRYQYKGLAKWLVVGGYIDPLKKKE